MYRNFARDKFKPVAAELEKVVKMREERKKAKAVESLVRLFEDLEKRGIGIMEPFSNFSYLKQAFTHGEVWAIDPKRIQKILDQGSITQKEADKFRTYGSIGSHLENLQRQEGYKGFNKDNVSFIMKKIDPRKVDIDVE